MRARILSCGLLAALTSACIQLGPHQLVSARGNYNEAIQRSANQQLLLNLVRMRYIDTPLFLEVTSISTHLKFTAGAQASTELPLGGPNSVSASTALESSEEPTVTYGPLQGERFARQMLSPIEMEKIGLLYYSGWSISRIFRICVENVNGIRNVPGASGPTPGSSSVDERFDRLVHTFHDLQERGALELGVERMDEGVRYSLRIASSEVDSPEVREVLEMLHLAPGKIDYPITGDPLQAGPDRLFMVTRSLMGSLFYLAQSIEVPEADLAAGRAILTHGRDGQPLDWPHVTGGLLHVKASVLCPNDAFVAARYRGSCFYVADSDAASKTTFLLLNELLSLQAGRVPVTAPVLTLPVAR
jgi:hypothetical protein